MDNSISSFGKTRPLSFYGTIPSGATEIQVPRSEYIKDLKPLSYQRLSTSTQFRYLQLQPDSAGPIQCKLVVADITDTTLSYDALSYTWGSTTSSYPVDCDGMRIGVTKNLYHALLKIRSTVSTRNIWVDAICIDQTGSNEALQEKSIQVRMINRIFTQAKKVVVDLGEATMADTILGETLQLLASIPDDLWDLAKASAPLHSEAAWPTSYRKGFLEEMPQAIDDSRWRSLQRLVARSWFSRLWVVQEYIVGQQIVMLLGNDELEYDILRGIGRAIMYLRDLSEKSDTLQMLRFDWKLLEQANYRIKQMREIRRQRQSSLPKLLEIALGAEVGLPRDRLYSILGLLSKRDQDRIDVDYQSSISHVCCQLAAVLIERGFGTYLLARCAGLDKSVPSWCVDLEKMRTITWLIDFREDSNFQEYRACGHTALKLEISSDQRILYASVVMIDEIESVSTAAPRSPWEAGGKPFSQELSNQVIAEAVQWEQNTHQWYEETFSPAKADPYWMTLTGQVLDKGKDLEKCRQTYRRARDYTSSIAEEQDQTAMTTKMTSDYRTFYTSWYGVAEGRRMAKSTAGRLALTPGETEPGDLICMILGFPAPFVVRRNQEEFRMVGPCYVYGLMKGKVMRSKDLEIQTVAFC